MALTMLQVLAFSVMICTGPITWYTETAHAAPQKDIDVVDFEGLQEYLAGFGDDKVLVINFWATWCGPCVKELPYFEQLTAHYDSEEVEVILVSLDFKNQIEKRVIPFLEEQKLLSHVILLYDPDANAWIDRVSPDWSGAIPATLIRRGGNTAFYEQSFRSLEELQSIIQPFLKS